MPYFCSDDVIASAKSMMEKNASLLIVPNVPDSLSPPARPAYVDDGGSDASMPSGESSVHIGDETSRRPDGTTAAVPAVPDPDPDPVAAALAGSVAEVAGSTISTAVAEWAVRPISSTWSIAGVGGCGAACSVGV
jgi:hypothetical protein